VKIRIDLTVDVPRESLEALRELACATTNTEAAEFVRSDVCEHLHAYLGSNGVNDITITEPWERRRA
jgi:hypothetical protein